MVVYEGVLCTCRGTIVVRETAQNCRCRSSIVRFNMSQGYNGTARQSNGAIQQPCTIALHCVNIHSNTNRLACDSWSVQILSC